MSHPLTKIEEQALARLSKNGNTEARQQLLEANLWIVKPTVGHMAKVPLQDEDWTDLEQEGYLGMMEALDRFDPDKGTRFSTYATYWVRMRVRDALRKLSTRMTSLEGSIDLPHHSVSDDPDEILPLRDALPDDSPNPAEQAELDDLIATMLPAIQRLPLRQRLVVEAYYGVGRPKRTMEWIAPRMQISPQRVRQILDQAMASLRRTLGADSD